MRPAIVIGHFSLLILATACASGTAGRQADPNAFPASEQQPTPVPVDDSVLDPTVPLNQPVAGIYATADQEINARSGPSTSFEVIARLLPGNQYVVVGTDQEWLELEVDGSRAWVFSYLVTLSGDPNSIAELNLPQSMVPLTPEAFEGQEAAIAQIRAFLGNGDLDLTFVELTLMINSPNADRQVAVFRDLIGNRYSIDPSTYAPAQIEPSGIHPQPGDPLPLEALRRAALEVAGGSPGFSENAASLRYEEGIKGDLHFFVWLDQDAGWKFNPPQLQVGMLQDGTLYTYLNTLIWAP